MSDDFLRALVDTRVRQVQKARVQFGNRLDALERGADEDGQGQQYAIVKKWLERFEALEAELDADIEEAVAGYEIYGHMSAVKGVGPMLAAKVIAMVDIRKAPTVSSLWRYAGYAVIDGERERPRKGEKLQYNKRLKTTVYLIGQSFLRSGSPYREEYDRARAYYDEERPEWTKGHCHLAAMRKMSKLFLSHLWVTWRRLEGLPTRNPYAHEKLGHTSLELPVEYGWPGLEIGV